MNTETIRRSKIYTYFYGKNTVFQQFVIITGIMFLLLTGVAEQANYKSYQNKREKAYVNEQHTYDVYYDTYNECRRLFDVDWDEYVDVEKGDRDYDKKIEYNNALEEYLDAQERLSELYFDHTGSFFAKLLNFLGWLSIIVGAVWMIYKKWSFNRDGEKEFDEELQYRIEEAKKKGLEKLNIISDQIELVEPVVLNGVARMDNPMVAISKGLLKNLFGSIWQFVLIFDKFILGLIAVWVVYGISSAISVNTIVFTFVILAVLGGVGAGGYFLYKTFEIDSYVSPRVIERLNKFTPNFISKLGSDDNVRVSLPAITVYMFGDDQLYMYYQYLDIVTGRVFCEGVHEYFYEDIVGITSSQETKKIFKRYGFMKLFLRSIDYLKESITVVSSGCTHQESYIVDVGNSLLDTQFIGMRNLIRQKKAEK